MDGSEPSEERLGPMPELGLPDGNDHKTCRLEPGKAKVVIAATRQGGMMTFALYLDDDSTQPMDEVDPTDPVVVSEVDLTFVAVEAIACEELHRSTLEP